MTTTQQAVSHYNIKDIQIIISHYLFLSSQLELCNKKAMHYYCLSAQNFKTIQSQKSAEYESVKYMLQKYSEELNKLYAATEEYKKQFKTAFFRYAFIEYRSKLSVLFENNSTAFNSFAAEFII